MSESIEENRFFDEFFEFCYIRIGRFSWELTSGGFCELDGIKWGSGVSAGRSSGFGTERSGRWSLSGCESIVLVVEHEIGNRIVTPAGMEKMSETDSVSVSVSSDADYVGFRICELDPDGERYRSSMEGFCCIAIDVLGNLPTTSNTAHDNNILLRDFEFLQSFSDGSEDEEISTSGAPLYEI